MRLTVHARARYLHFHFHHSTFRNQARLQASLSPVHLAAAHLDYLDLSQLSSFTTHIILSQLYLTTTHYLTAPTPPSSSSNITSRYPVAYFLCDVTLTGKILKALLGLDKVPRLRTAQITGFRRGMGDSGANVVVYDGSNFG